MTQTADLYVGARLTITAGTNVGESRTIVAYDSSTQTLTVSPAFSSVIDTTSAYKIDTPEIFSVSQGTITITSHTVSLSSPSTFHDINDYFDIDQKLDTNGQAITAANIHINFNASTLELADATKPFSTLVASATTTANGATPVYTTLIASALASVDDLYKGNQIIITSGVAKGERRTIVDYNGTTKTVIVDKPFSRQIVTGVTFRIDNQLSGSTTIGSWSVTVVNNSGNNTAGQSDLVVVSTVSNAKSFASMGNFVTLTFKTKAAGNVDVTYAFDETNGRLTHLIDNTGAEHIPHDGNSVHIKITATLNASISGQILLEGRTNHQENVTLELRKPGSIGHFSSYTSPEDTDANTAGIQLQTTTDGSFKITRVPDGKYFLTAKASHYLRGQNHHTIPLEITPGESITGVQIRGYNDANADGDFADTGEEFNFLLAGEAGTQDNQITATDVTTVANNLGKTDPAALAAADINGDGKVDVDDFTFIAKNFGQTAIPPIGVPGVANAAPAGRTIEGLFELAGLPEEMELGEEIKVEVQLKNASHVVGYGFDLTFGSGKFVINDVAEGRLLKRQKKTFFVSKRLKTKDGQKLVVGNAVQRPVSGTGAVLTFTLKPVVLGDVDLTTSHGQLIYRDGNIDLDGTSKQYMVRVVPKKIVTKNVLLQNYPNPFNPETWMPYALKAPGYVKIYIYNAAGQQVRTLELGYQKSAGYITRDKAAYWDGRNALGETVSSSVYFYRLEAGDFSATRKMLMVK